MNLNLENLTGKQKSLGKIPRLKKYLKNSISFLPSGLYRWYGNHTHSAIDADAYPARGLVGSKPLTASEEFHLALKLIFQN